MIQDDDIDIEEEIDLDDPVHAGEGELSGNQLLHQHYLLDEDEPDQQMVDPKGK